MKVIYAVKDNVARITINRPEAMNAMDPEVYAELLASYDEGVAEFLDLEHVKPNTLGNTRMLLHLTPRS